MPQNGSKNLKPVKTVKEAREKGKNGGIKSGEVRRKKREKRELIELILKCKPNVNELPAGMLKQISALGIDPKGLLNNDELLAIALFGQSLNDIASHKYLDDIMERNPAYLLKKRELDLKEREIALREKEANQTQISAPVVIITGRGENESDKITD